MPTQIKYLPDDLYPASMDVNIEFNNVIHTSPFNHKEQIEQRSGERWTFRFNYDEMERNEARKLQAFILSLNGVVGRFYAKDYAFFDRQGEISGTPKVDGNLNTGKTCKLKDCPRNRDIFYPGDYVKISGRLHMITEAVRSDAAGKATIEFAPAMLIVPTDNATVEYDNFTVTCRLKDDRQGKRSSRDMSNSLSFEAVEVL